MENLAALEERTTPIPKPHSSLLKIMSSSTEGDSEAVGSGQQPLSPKEPITSSNQQLQPEATGSEDQLLPDISITMKGIPADLIQSAAQLIINIWSSPMVWMEGPSVWNLEKSEENALKEKL